MAPARAGSAVVGDGPADVAELIDWDRSDAANLMSGEPPGEGPLRSTLERCAKAIVYSRSAALVAGVADIVRTVVRHDPQPAPGVHATEWMCRPLADLGIPRVAVTPPCVPTEAERAKARELTDRLPAAFLAVHPGSGSPTKNWPPTAFTELIASQSGGRPWLLIQGPADTTPAEPLAQVPAAVRATELPPRVLGTVLSLAGLYVGNDSGVSHLAAAWGAPAVVLFGPTDPAVWAPEGRSVRVVRSPTGRMEDLTVSAVLAAAGPR
jgi:ADP-heptose:LPS heptosyltransferase